MARSLRDIKRQIKSVRSTQQITRAMKMVAAAKLRRAQTRMLALRPYANDLAELLAPVLEEAAGDEHAFLRPATAGAAGEGDGKTGLVFVAADRGLCGGFNMNLVRRAERFLAEDAAGKPVSLICVGRKAWDHARRRKLDVLEHYEDVFDRVPFSVAASLADRVAARFESGELAEVYLLHAEFVSAMKQVQVVKRLLPLDRETLESALPHPAEPRAPMPPGEAAVARGAEGEPTLEPALAPLADALLRRFVATQIYRALLESYASELGARMTAMEAATENAEDMVAQLTLDYNRARQATITRELLDIVGGAEAMKT